MKIDFLKFQLKNKISFKKNVKQYKIKFQIFSGAMIHNGEFILSKFNNVYL